MRVVPDLIVEVLSNKTASQDRGEKKAIYERNGVREYWLIDSRSRKVTVFHLEEKCFDRGRFHTEDEVVMSRVLEGFAVKVGEFLP